MTEMRRLLEETESDAERALLQAGRSYRGSRETRSKALAALGLAGSSAIVVVTATSGTAVSATATATASASAGTVTASTSVAASVGSTAVGSLAALAGTSGAKILVALSLAGVGTAVPLGYWALHQRPEPPALVHRAGPSRSASAPPASAASNAVVAGPAADQGDGPEPAPPPPPADVLAAPAPGPRLRTGGARPVPVSLSQELAALDAARATLARGNAEGALFLLDGYDRSCPRGKLAVEAEILRIDALAKNGQARDARRRAEQFVKQHPTSVLAVRARTYLGD
jgi:hypothetical protein